MFLSVIYISGTVIKSIFFFTWTKVRYKLQYFHLVSFVCFVLVGLKTITLSLPSTLTIVVNEGPGDRFFIRGFYFKNYPKGTITRTYRFSSGINISVVF